MWSHSFVCSSSTYKSLVNNCVGYCRRLHYWGIALSFVGMGVVGTASLSSGQGGSSAVDPSKMAVGMLLIVISQALQAGQCTAEVWRQSNFHFKHVVNKGWSKSGRRIWIQSISLYTYWLIMHNWIAEGFGMGIRQRLWDPNSHLILFIGSAKGRWLELYQIIFRTVTNVKICDHKTHFRSIFAVLVAILHRDIAIPIRWCTLLCQCPSNKPSLHQLS